MAQLALGFAQRAVTAVAQGFAARTISNLLGKRSDTGPRLTELHVLSSTDGAPMPIAYGRVRLGGQVIWADNPVENVIKRRAGGKGGPRIKERKYTLSFAVGICEGVIDGVGRIWADGALLAQNAGTFRVYKGDENQLADPLIESIMGTANTPGFRGLAYVVFEGFALEPFGNRIPQLSFEVFRTPPDPLAQTPLEQDVRAVTLIPGSGEFSYATQEVLLDLGPGKARSANVNNGRGLPDIEAALDDLEARLPACKTVSLVVSWFGDDLRCGEIKLKPRIDDPAKMTIGMQWGVSGLTRSGAQSVSFADGRPVFGGTPSDNAVLQAIATLKARGFSVIFYPFILMDVPAGNGLPDPYGASEQAAFPWRGRITSFPAPDMPGTPDKSSAIVPQIDAFFGQAAVTDFIQKTDTVDYAGPPEWSYRRMILHYAHLCALAGGVDAFLVGSELRAMTRLRSDGSTYPVVAHLRTLLADVRTLLPQAKLSYAADWSEYFGHQPQDGSGDVFFHLDEFWADANTDFVGIDWYIPLSDWREGQDHADAGAYSSLYDAAYLSGNHEGGEGYDWFYASDADRDAQLRTSIIDGAYGKDWVFRYKDIRSWWSEPHYNRPGGVEAAQPTAWVPQSRPIWFTETGCPAVDKGANQPNVFFDPKSAESQLPYFSNGQRDDLVQRAYLHSLFTYWSAAAGQNPQSSVYSAPMVDVNHICVWTWDARPFPDFPARQDVWSDGPNWARGHWLSGRMGLSSLGAIVHDLAARAGVTNVGVNALRGVVTGYAVNGPTTARQALEPLSAVYQFDMAEQFGSLKFIGEEETVSTVTIDPQEIVVSRGRSAIEYKRKDEEETPLETRIRFIEDGHDYQPAQISARGADAEKRRAVDMSLPLVSDSPAMVRAARQILTRASDDARGLDITLAPSRLALEGGDVVAIQNGFGQINWRIASIAETGPREISLHPSLQIGAAFPAGATPGMVALNQQIQPPPVLVLMDLPLLPQEEKRFGLRIAAFADPWPGSVVVRAGLDGQERARLDAPASVGEIMTALPAGGFFGRWDFATRIDVRLYGGFLSSLSAADVLQGKNALAMQHANGKWEIVQFQEAVLTGTDTYTLKTLLRGVSNSDDAFSSPVDAGARFVLFDGSTQTMDMRSYEQGVQTSFRAGYDNTRPGGSEESLANITFEDRGSRLPSPVHVAAQTGAGGVDITWVRRALSGGDNWGAGDVPLEGGVESYRLRLYDSQGGVLFESTTAMPVLTISTAQMDALFPSSWPSTLTIGVAQISTISGIGVESVNILHI